MPLEPAGSSYCAPNRLGARIIRCATCFCVIQPRWARLGFYLAKMKRAIYKNPRKFHETRLIDQGAQSSQNIENPLKIMIWGIFRGVFKKIESNLYWELDNVLCVFKHFIAFLKTCWKPIFEKVFYFFRAGTAKWTGFPKIEPGCSKTLQTHQNPSKIT